MNKKLKYKITSMALILAMILSLNLSAIAADYGQTYYEKGTDQYDLYMELMDFAEDIAENGGSTKYTFSCSYSDTGTASAVLSEYLNNELDISSMIQILLADNPYDLYWFDKTTGVACSGTAKVSGQSVTLTSVILYFSVSDGYGEDYEVDSEIAQATSEIVDAAEDIVEEYADLDTEERLESYKDEICSLVSYNSEAATGTVSYGDPWQLIYVFDGDDTTNVVCEGYSKAFQFLCDLTWSSDVTCYTVTGTLNGGAHMWNIIDIDGSRYIADTTNSDTGTIGQKGGLFLTTETSGSASEGYVFTISNTSVTYVYDDDMFGIYGDILTLGENTKTDISVAVIELEEYTYTYDGTAKEPTTTVTLGSEVLTEETDYTLTYTDNTEVGIATVTAIGKGNYTGEVSTTFTIVESGAVSIMEAEITLEEDSYVYDGSEKEPAVSVTLDGTALIEDTDYVVEYSDNINAGEAMVTVTGISSYTDTATAAFIITAKDMSSAVMTLSSDSFTYDGEAKEPTATIVLDGTTLIMNIDYVLTYEDNIEAGTAAVTATGIGNYGGTVSRTFTIEEKSGISISDAAVTLSYNSTTYDGTAKKPSVTVKIGKQILKANKDYTVEYSDNINVGTATVTIIGIGDYTDTLTKSFTIKVASIVSAKITLSQNSYTYDGEAKEPTVTVKVGNKTLTEDTDYTVSYKNNTEIGTATVTVKGIGNYTGSASAKFTISLDDTSLKTPTVSGKKITLKWDSAKGLKYQIAYKVGNGSWKYKTTSGTSLTLSNLSSGKYQIKIRTYTTVGKTTYYGEWSDTQSVTVK